MSHPDSAQKDDAPAAGIVLCNALHFGIDEIDFAGQHFVRNTGIPGLEHDRGLVRRRMISIHDKMLDTGSG